MSDSICSVALYSSTFSILKGRTDAVQSGLAVLKISAVFLKFNSKFGLIYFSKSFRLIESLFSFF